MANCPAISGTDIHSPGPGYLRLALRSQAQHVYLIRHLRVGEMDLMQGESTLDGHLLRRADLARRNVEPGPRTEAARHHHRISLHRQLQEVLHPAVRHVYCYIYYVTLALYIDHKPRRRHIRTTQTCVNVIQIGIAGQAIHNCLPVCID